MPAVRQATSTHRDCAQERPRYARRLGEKAIAQTVLEKAAAEARTAEVLAEEAVRTGVGAVTCSPISRPGDFSLSPLTRHLSLSPLLSLFYRGQR